MQKENAPTIVDNLFALPVKTTKEEDPGEDEREKSSKGGRRPKIQADSGQKAAEDSDYSDYSNSDFIH